MKAFGLSLFLSIFLVGIATAAPEDVANDVSDEIMSPYCEGVTLHDCPSQAALDLRAEIEEWARDGMTKSQILDRLVDEYGETILARPQADLAWLLPALLIAAGVLTAWTVLVRITPKRRTDFARVQISNDERQRLDAELQTLRERA